MKRRLRKKLSKRLKRRHFDFMRGVEHGIMLVNSMGMIYRELPLSNVFFGPQIFRHNKPDESSCPPGNLMQILKQINSNQPSKTRDIKW